MRYGTAFIPIVSTSPAFQLANTTGGNNIRLPFEDASVNRVWQGPSNRAVFISVLSTQHVFVKFGSSSILTGSNAVRMQSESAETFYIRPADIYIGMQSSTGAVISVTLGYGGPAEG